MALSEKKRDHIPYRNSILTSVLRDSLGGNALTTMIATVSLEKRNLQGKKCSKRDQSNAKAFFNRHSETFNFDPLTLNQISKDFLHRTLRFFSILKIRVQKSYTPPSQFLVLPLSDFGFNLLMKSQHVWKPFENWLRVSDSKLNVSAFEFKKCLFIKFCFPFTIFMICETWIDHKVVNLIIASYVKIFDLTWTDFFFANWQFPKDISATMIAKSN